MGIFHPNNIAIHAPMIRLYAEFFTQIFETVFPLGCMSKRKTTEKLANMGLPGFMAPRFLIIPQVILRLMRQG